MNIRRTTLAGAAGLLVLLSACAEPLVDPEVVAGVRVLGARVSAAEEPARAELRAGESASLQWWIVADSPRDFSAHVVLCRGKETSLGLQECDGAPFVERDLQGDTSVPLQLDFELPAANGAEHWLAWVGVCADAAPSFDRTSRSFDCERGKAVEGVYEARFVNAERAANHNPDLSDDRLQNGKVDWPALERGVVPGQACKGESLPVVRAGKTIHLHWRSTGDDREALEPDGEYESPQRESLVFTHVATEAGLERAFSAIDWNADNRGFDLDFTLPKTPRPPATGRSIGFYLIVRDERGGTAFEGRELCALP